MKIRKHWLLPALTCIMVLSAAIVPQQVSFYQDRQLFGRIHTEALSIDSNLSVWSATLPKKLALYNQWNYEPYGIVNAMQALLVSDDGRLEETVRTALKSMVEYSVIPEDAARDTFQEIGGNWLMLHDADSGESARFLTVWSIEEDHPVMLTLDEESNAVCELRIYHPSIFKDTDAPEEIGWHFFEAMGLEVELMDAGSEWAMFCLKDMDTLYLVSRYGERISIELAGFRDAAGQDYLNMESTISDYAG